jgi:hypothetical protein
LPPAAEGTPQTPKKSFKLEILLWKNHGYTRLLPSIAGVCWDYIRAPDSFLFRSRWKIKKNPQQARGRPRKTIIFHVCLRRLGLPPRSPLTEMEDRRATVTDSLQSTTFRLHSSAASLVIGAGDEPLHRARRINTHPLLERVTGGARQDSAAHLSLRNRAARQNRAAHRSRRCSEDPLDDCGAACGVV